jgi:hypothetical protein
MHASLESQTGVSPDTSSSLVLYVPPCRNDSYEDQLDLREQLVNDRLKGPIHQVQLPKDGITSLHGVMLDIDPKLINPQSVGCESFSSPNDFYTRVIRPMLDRHPTLAEAHVRCSGNGLHVILFFDKPVMFSSEAERELWANRTQVVQSLLPSDPRCPGLTALTRSLGSINSKNNAKVFELAAGDKVSAHAVEALCQELVCQPFKTVATILFGPGSISPCPICKKPGCRLGVLDREGRCYGCGKVTLEMLYDYFFTPLNTTKE